MCLSGVNFTNVLRAAFALADLKRAKGHLTAYFALWGSLHVKAAHRMLAKSTPDQRKSIGAKAAYRTLMKLRQGVNFINVLRTAFTHADSKCAKKTVKSAQCRLALLGSTSVKAAYKTLMKLRQGV